MPRRTRRLVALAASALLAALAVAGVRMTGQPPAGTPPTRSAAPPPGAEGEAPGGLPPADHGHLFSPEEVRPGDEVAGLTVVQVDYRRDADGLIAALVRFSGQVTVTGTYVHHPDDEEVVGGEVCLHDLDAASQARLPRLREDIRDLWFCFTNTQEAREALAPAGVGVATVTVDDYTIDLRPTETWNRGRLVRVERVERSLP